ncbi:MAG TPA: metallophosphoesterase [Burkholderiales bacterium]|nr:metallophosphoesterase [Burkholderiales bacterium]
MSRFALVVTALLAVAYSYVASRLAAGLASAAALAVPFALIWIMPVLYWGTGRSREGWLDQLVHRASYLSMAWVSFALVLTLARDLLLLATLPAPLAGAHAEIAVAGVPIVLGGSLVAIAVGAAAAFRGPRIERVDLPIAGLHPDLDGYRIVQISDLHVGPNIGRRYVQRVVDLCRTLDADLVVLTGDIVDGPVPQLAADVAPLAELARGGRAFFILGNHDCYAGAGPWIAHWREAGMQVLLNSHEIVRKGAARLLVGGVVDPAYGRLRPEISIGEPADFRLLLAHNPRLAPLGAKAGFDLQLSGHTHAGQFFPWTLAVRLVHAPHVAGLSREGKMLVYVSAGTGTWGPPVRFGTNPELTLLRLVRA